MKCSNACAERSSRHAMLFLVLATVFSFGGSAHAQEAPSLEALLRAFSELPGLHARFHEEKRIALLAVPVRSEGEIFYTPGKLLRRVSSPTPSVALIDGARLVVRSGSERQVIEFADNPVVAAFVGSMRHVLAGDLEALRADYEVDFEADGPRWTMTLRPRGQALRRFLREMVLTGEGHALTRMRMAEVSGDTTVTEFDQIDADRNYSAAERRRIFRVE